MRRTRLFAGAVCALAYAGTAPAAAQTLELRAGIAVSSALAEDLIANPRLEAALGDAWTGPARAEPSTGLAVTLAGTTPLRGRSSLEIALGWTAARLDAVDAAGTREIQTLGAGQATIGIRYALAGPADAGCAVGLLHYFADSGLFEGGSGLSPVVGCGGGIRIGATQRAFTLRVTAEAHRFRTPVLRDAGAQSGSVLRLIAQAGFAIGRER